MRLSMFAESALMMSALIVSGLEQREAMVLAQRALEVPGAGALILLRKLELYRLEDDELAERAAAAGFDRSWLDESRELIELLARVESIDELCPPPPSLFPAPHEEVTC